MNKKHPSADTPDPAIKPAVIELDAEDVTPAEDAAAADPADAPPPPKRKSALYSGKWLVAALIGGGLLGGWLYRDVISQWLPTNEVAALTNKVAALEVQDKAAQDQIAVLTGQISGLSGDISRVEAVANDAAAKSGEATTASSTASDAARELRLHLDALEENLSDLSNRVALASPPAAIGGGDGAAPGALAALAQRVEALEKDVASLKAPNADKATAVGAMTSALADLKARVAAGQPFEAEFARVQNLVPAAAGLDVLGPQARLGLPNAQGLAEELKAAISTLPAPQAGGSPPAAEPGYFDWLWNKMGSLVTVRNEGESDWPTLAAKAAALAEAGDLTQAIDIINQGGEVRPNALTQWRDRARARLDLESALAAVSDAVLRAIAAKG